jgi:predicted nucleotidyltransferase
MAGIYPPNAYQTICPDLVRLLESRPNLLFAMLYGSAAAGEPFHDLDIALYVDRVKAPASEDLTLAFALADQLEAVSPYPIDVHVINDAPLGFRYNVSKCLPLLINDEEAYFHFLERTWDDYLDFYPVAMQYIRDLA